MCPPATPTAQAMRDERVCKVRFVGVGLQNYNLVFEKQSTDLVFRWCWVLVRPYKLHLHSEVNLNKTWIAKHL